MDNVLIDTSVWINFFGGKDQKIISAVQELLYRDKVVICPPVYQEILQGIKYPKEFLDMKDRFGALKQLHADPIQAAEGAAQIYSVLRSKGVTIRKSNDCLIAWYAMTSDAVLFHLDRDFVPISEFFKLRFYLVN
ncbi:PIN domain nuclease [Belliella sp. DSM 107340]|uniref:Ribonuclease VapC n=1 Tax=Belliella calami TaxID=2923436 RepID=A0ABS9USG4_9BACT|nr:PIN domain nuclease [Belliella calami]MCH7399567.1 PIN domain nuclease [Belliella calami]